jgi:hypothetical protein
MYSNEKHNPYRSVGFGNLTHGFALAGFEFLQGTTWEITGFFRVVSLTEISIKATLFDPAIYTSVMVNMMITQA